MRVMLIFQDFLCGSDNTANLERDDNRVGMCLDVTSILSTAGAYHILQLCYLFIQTVDVLSKTQRTNIYNR